LEKAAKALEEARELRDARRADEADNRIAQAQVDALIDVALSARQIVEELQALQRAILALIEDGA
jgi:oligoendopeptidase F